MIGKKIGPTHEIRVRRSFHMGPTAHPGSKRAGEWRAIVAELDKAGVPDHAYPVFSPDNGTTFEWEVEA